MHFYLPFNSNICDRSVFISPQIFVLQYKYSLQLSEWKYLIEKLPLLYRKNKNVNISILESGYKTNELPLLEITRKPGVRKSWWIRTKFLRTKRGYMSSKLLVPWRWSRKVFWSGLKLKKLLPSSLKEEEIQSRFWLFKWMTRTESSPGPPLGSWEVSVPGEELSGTTWGEEIWWN